ncbi:MAG: stalk domain-containing protein [Tepidanaerobacteraceae bacterium]|nr:copper amine oxidase N-terminal domain-containing protein [Thermoanaerobacterales bacterium]
MKKKTLILLSALLVTTILFSSMALGAVTAKDIKAYYRNIKIKANGNIITSTQAEPFIYNDTTYVPIRLVAEALDKVVDWDNNQSTVIINDKTSYQQELNSLRAQNSYLQGMNIDLQRKIKELEDEIKELEEKKSNTDDLEDYLYDEYSDWNDIEFDFNVKESKGDLTLTIEFDRYDFKSKWNKLTDRKIERWLDDIFDFVKDEFPKAGFKGTIEDTDEDETLVKFEKSGSSLKIKFYDDRSSSGTDLEEELNDMFGSGLSGYHKNFGKLKAQIEVDEDSKYEELYITVIVDTSRYSDEWADVRDTAAADDWIYDIAEYAYEEYKGYWIEGHVEDSRGRTQAYFECSSSGRITIDWE